MIADYPEVERWRLAYSRLWNKEAPVVRCLADGLFHVDFDGHRVSFTLNEFLMMARSAESEIRSRDES